MGTGGVGGYFGAKLAKTGEEVYLIARGAHLQAMIQNGLIVKSPTGDFTLPVSLLSPEGGPAPATASDKAFATDEPKAIGPVDLILFCVKTYDTEAASAALFPLIGPRTLILSLQNGVDSADKLGRDHGRNHILGGTVYIFTALESPGVIAQSGGPCKIIFGELDGTAIPRLAEIKTVFDRAGFPNDISKDIRKTLWEKFAMICANGGMSALTRVTLGEMLARESTRAMIEKTMREVVNVGTAEGVSWDNRFVERTMKFLETVEPQGRSSMYHDLVNNRKLELASLNGRVVQLAKQHGIPVPMNFAIYAALAPHMR